MKKSSHKSHVLMMICYPFQYLIKKNSEKQPQPPTCGDVLIKLCEEEKRSKRNANEHKTNSIKMQTCCEAKRSERANVFFYFLFFLFYFIFFSFLFIYFSFLSFLSCVFSIFFFFYLFSFTLLAQTGPMMPHCVRGPSDQQLAQLPVSFTFLY